MMDGPYIWYEGYTPILLVQCQTTWKIFKLPYCHICLSDIPFHHKKKDIKQKYNSNAQICWITFQYKFIGSSFITMFYKYSESTASSILIAETALWPHNLVKCLNYDHVRRPNSELNTLLGNSLYLISYKFKLTRNSTEVSEQLTLQTVCRFPVIFMHCFLHGSNLISNAYLDLTATTSVEEEEPSALQFLSPPKFFGLSGKMWVVPTFFVRVNFCKAEALSLWTGGFCVDPTLVWPFPWSADKITEFDWDMRKGEEGNSDFTDARLLLCAEDGRRGDDESLHPVLEAYFELSPTAHFLSRSRTLFMFVIFFVISVQETKTKSTIMIWF